MFSSIQIDGSSAGPEVAGIKEEEDPSLAKWFVWVVQVVELEACVRIQI